MPIYTGSNSLLRIQVLHNFLYVEEPAHQNLYFVLQIIFVDIKQKFIWDFFSQLLDSSLQVQSMWFFEHTETAFIISKKNLAPLSTLLTYFQKSRLNNSLIVIKFWSAWTN